MANATMDEIANLQEQAKPTLKENTRVAKKMKKVLAPGAMRLTSLPQDMGEIPFARDPYAETMDARLQIQDPFAYEEQPGRRGPGAPIADILGLKSEDRAPGAVTRTLPITEEEIEFAIRQQQQQEQLEFDAFFLSQFDMTNPAIVRMVEEMYPDYFERMDKFIDSKLAIVKQYTRLVTRGIRSREDALFKYALMTGRLVMPSGFQSFQAMVTPLEGTGYPAGTSQAFGSSIERGMGNILNFLTNDAGIALQGYNINNQAFQAAFLNQGGQIIPPQTAAANAAAGGGNREARTGGIQAQYADRPFWGPPRNRNNANAPRAF